MLKLLLIFLSVTILHTPQLEADTYLGDITRQELNLIPDFCEYLYQRFGVYRGRRFSEAEQTQISQILKSQYAGVGGLHHYCNGLVREIRAKSAPGGGKKKYNYRLAIGEYKYVIHHSTADAVLLPDLWLRIGKARLARGEHVKAVYAFNTVMQIKPDYTPAYAYMSDVYIKLGDIEHARSVIEKGLKVVPESGLLNARLKSLKK